MPKIKLNETRKSSFVVSIRKFLLVLRRDRRVQFSILSFVVFVVFFGSSFYLLPLGNNPSGNSVNLKFNLQPGTSTTYSSNLIMPPGSYINISYSVPTGSSGSFSIYGKPYGFLATGSLEKIVDENVTGSGSYSFHNIHSDESIIYTLSAGRGNSSGSPDFVVSENPYYAATFNPYIFMLAILGLVVACIGLGSSIMRMEKNLHMYYEKLGWYKLINRETFGDGDASGKVKDEYAGRNHPRKMNALVFMVPGLLFYIFGVIVGQSSNGGYLLLSILSYGIASAFVFGALIASLLSRMA